MEPSLNEERIRLLEQRLSHIEKILRIQRQELQPANPVPSEPDLKTSATGAKSAPVTPSAPPVTQIKPGQWLGLIAVICFVLAAGFIIKLSIESGWLTPERQIGLAALLGLTLIGVGLSLLRRDREYASLLPGAGIIVLYVTVFAAHRFYVLIPFEVATAAITLVSGLCIWLYSEIKHDVYPLTAAVGSYVAPLLLDFNTASSFSIYYFILCSLAFATLSIGVRSRLLTMIAAYLAILMTSWIGFSLHQDGAIAVVLAVHFLIFSCGTYFYTKRTQKPLNEKEAWSFLPVLLVFYATEYYFIDRLQPNLAPWISLLFAGFFFGLYLSAKRWFPQRTLASQSMILSFVTVICFHSIYLELLPPEVKPWLFVLIVLGFVFLPFNFLAQKKDSLFRLPSLALLGIVAIEYLSMVSHLISHPTDEWIFVCLASFVSLWILLTVGGKKMDHPHQGHGLLGAAHVLAVLGFYRLTSDYGSLAVSASWLFYAVCVIAFAFSRRDEVMAKSALMVLSFAAGKALLYDTSSAPSVLRILCLLLTGIVLYGSGFLMRKMATWKR